MFQCYRLETGWAKVVLVLFFCRLVNVGTVVPMLYSGNWMGQSGVSFVFCHLVNVETAVPFI